MKRVAVVATVVLLVIGAPALAATRAEKRTARRAAIDSMAQHTLDQLVANDERAARLYRQSVGFAVFDNFKLSLIVSGGGGVGVAVDRERGSKVYMKSGSGGIGLGLGGQSYQLVFFFEDRQAFQKFVDKGWQADASANAVAGGRGKNAEATFSQGVAAYQITHKGFMVQVDISGSRYWKHRRLNRLTEAPPANAEQSTQSIASASAGQ